MNENQIILEGAHMVVFREANKASEAITPGQLIEDGGAEDVQKHSTADGNAMKRFAVESTLHGAEPAGKEIDRDYAVGETIREGFCPTGIVVYAWLAAGENVAKDADLASDGAGALQAVTAAAATSQAQRNGIVARAEEAVNNSAGTVAVRIKVRVY